MDPDLVQHAGCKLQIAFEGSFEHDWDRFYRFVVLVADGQT